MHLDDPNPTVQQHILTVLQQQNFVKIEPNLFLEIANNVREKHHNKTYIDELIKQATQ